MPIVKEVTLDHVLDVLNRAVEADSDAIRNLVEQRVQCNKTLADDPTIQVGNYHKAGVMLNKHVFGNFSIGLLGILNGLFGVDETGWGAIAAVFDVVYPNCALDQLNGNVGDKCESCDNKLVLGKLTKFVKAYKD